MGLDNGLRGDYNNVRSFRMKSYNETGRRRDPYEIMRNEYRAYLQQCKEQESLYHQIALSLGLPDSVLYLLYTIAEQGDRKRLYRASGPSPSRRGTRPWSG